MSFFSEINKNKDNIICVYPLDDGRSREKIVDGIREILEKMDDNLIVNQLDIDENNNLLATRSRFSPIVAEDFNFSEFNESRARFNQYMDELSHAGNENIRAILNLREDWVDAIKTLEEKKEQLDMEKKYMESIEAGKKMQTLVNILESSKIIGHRNKEKRDNKIKERSELLREKDRLDTSEPVCYVVDKFDRDFSWYKPLGWFYNEFKIDTNGIPIVKIEQSPEKETNWQVNEKDSLLSSGKYKAIYQSNTAIWDFYTSVKASVTAYVQSKDLPSNALRIREIDNQLFLLGTEIESINNEIRELESNISTISSEIKEFNLNGLEHLDKNKTVNADNRSKEKIKKLESDVKNQENKIKEFSRQSKRLDVEFKYMKPAFDVIIEFNRLLNLSSTLVKTFIEFYNDFLSKYYVISTNYSVKTFFEDLRQESNPGLEDNSQLKALRTFKGTIFDKQTLLEKFKDGSKIYQHKHDDGSIEDILLGHWEEIALDVSDLKSFKLNNTSLNSKTSRFFCYTGVDNSRNVRDGESLLAKNDEVESIKRTP